MVKPATCRNSLHVSSALLNFPDVNHTKEPPPRDPDIRQNALFVTVAGKISRRWIIQEFSRTPEHPAQEFLRKVRQGETHFLIGEEFLCEHYFH